MHLALSLLFAAVTHAAVHAPTPLPVNVRNFPGPDAVALDTLKYARWAFWATVAVGVVTVIGTGFAFVDYLLNIRQFRKPKLSVSLRGASRDARPLPLSYRDDGKDYTFVLPLQLNNDGARAANGCYVTIWLPKPLEWWQDYKPWTYGGDLFEDGKVVYQRAELFVKEPAFVDHPILLPNVGVRSAKGATEFHIRWQVSDESGKTPAGTPAFIQTGIDEAPGVRKSAV